MGHGGRGDARLRTAARYRTAGEGGYRSSLSTLSVASGHVRTIPTADLFSLGIRISCPAASIIASFDGFTPIDSIPGTDKRRQRSEALFWPSLRPSSRNIVFADNPRSSSPGAPSTFPLFHLSAFPPFHISAFPPFTFHRNSRKRCVSPTFKKCASSRLFIRREKLTGKEAAGSSNITFSSRRPVSHFPRLRLDYSLEISLTSCLALSASYTRIINFPSIPHLFPQ
jgi:hypothetical protein